MQFEFSPVRSDHEFTLSVEGDIVTIDAEGFDFSSLTEGDILPGEAIASDWVLGAQKEAGVVIVKLLLPHSADAPDSRRFPEVIVADSGAVNLPANEVAE